MFPLPLQALLPLYGTRQVDNLGAVINVLLTDPSCEEKLIRNSTGTHGSTFMSLRDITTLKSVTRGIKELSSTLSISLPPPSTKVRHFHSSHYQTELIIPFQSKH